MQNPDIEKSQKGNLEQARAAVDKDHRAGHEQEKGIPRKDYADSDKKSQRP